MPDENERERENMYIHHVDITGAAGVFVLQAIPNINKKPVSHCFCSSHFTSQLF